MGPDTLQPSPFVTMVQNEESGDFSIVLKNIGIFAAYTIIPYVLVMLVPFFGGLFAFIYIFLPLHLLTLVVTATADYKKGNYRKACLSLYSIFAILFVVPLLFYAILLGFSIIG